MYEDFLPLVQKPARYINTEINSVHKDLSRVRTKVCLFFPDTYEVGMSHLGIRILYDILNRREDTVCERVFSPWTDYEEKLRAAGRPLTSLESNLPLSEFDIIGISLQYELSYTNILTGLDLAGIPLHAKDRTGSHPIVIAGGPCAVNPEPISDFIDVFFIGEAEEAVHEIVELKQQCSGKRQFLEAIAKGEGFYVPAFGGSSVRRRYLKDIDRAPYPERPLLPLLKPIHDRVTVEVARGCIRGCRFCQAGVIYRPFRERSPERVKNILRESLACTGYEEISLASLSSGDYSSIEPLIVELMETYRDSRVSVSLPSLRVGTLTPAMIEAIAGTRKTGFTLAPEAGTERLRRVINKPVTDGDLMEAAQTVFANGWSVLKLYFMIGLPTETDEDLDGIIRLGNELLARSKRSSKRHVQINISVSTFVPKPHTPFQWFGQAPLEEIRRKQAYLEKGLRRRGINLKLHDPRTSLLEGAFARGDRSLGRVIEEAARQGCRFDGWSESFDFSRWEEAFKQCGLDAAAYAARTFPLDQPLPWDHVQSGVTKKFLHEEYARAEAAEITGNCRMECMHCGIGCRDGGTPALGLAAAPLQDGDGKNEEVKVRANRAVCPEITTRVRVKYAKTGRVRFLSHLDFMTLFHRSVMRARVPIAFSRGFNPHPKIAFGPALSVGIESEAEYLDMETDPFIDLLQLIKELNASLPQGIGVLEARVVPRSAPSLSGSISRYDYRVAVPQTWKGSIEERIDHFLSRSSVMMTREGRSKDIRPCIEAMKATPSTGARELLITLQDLDQVRPRVQDVVAQCFETGQEQAVLFGIRRSAMYYKNRDGWASPMEV
jgi:radical SAM-linked protein